MSQYENASGYVDRVTACTHCAGTDLRIAEAPPRSSRQFSSDDMVPDVLARSVEGHITPRRSSGHGMTGLHLADANYERMRAERDAALDLYLAAAGQLLAAKQLLHAKIVQLGAAHKAADRQREQIAGLLGAAVEQDETEWMR